MGIEFFVESESASFHGARFAPAVKGSAPRTHIPAPTPPVLATPHARPCRGLTFVAGGPGLVAVVAGDAEDALLDGGEPHGRAGEVFHGAGPLQVLFNGLVHHQVLELPQLRADVGQPPGADIGGAPHAAAGRERGVSPGPRCRRRPPPAPGEVGGGRRDPHRQRSRPGPAAPVTFLAALRRSDPRERAAPRAGVR